MSHKQPELERHLRSKVDANAHCELYSSFTLTSIHEAGDWVYATCVDAQNRERRIRARFLVGADGKTGFTRKRYLEPRGVNLLWAEE